MSRFMMARQYNLEKPEDYYCKKWNPFENDKGKDYTPTPEEIADWCRGVILGILKKHPTNKYFDLTMVITHNSPATISFDATTASGTSGGVDPHTGGGPSQPTTP